MLLEARSWKGHGKRLLTFHFRSQTFGYGKLSHRNSSYKLQTKGLNASPCSFNFFRIRNSEHL